MLDFGSALQGIVMVLKVAVRLMFGFTAVVAFVAVVSTIISQLYIAVSTSVISDLIALVQIWLPFNLVPVLTWVLAVSLLYVNYRLALYALGFVRGIIGE